MAGRAGRAGHCKVEFGEAILIPCVMTHGGTGLMSTTDLESDVFQRCVALQGDQGSYLTSGLAPSSNLARLLLEFVVLSEGGCVEEGEIIRMFDKTFLSLSWTKEGRAAAGGGEGNQGEEEFDFDFNFSQSQSENHPPTSNEQSQDLAKRPKLTPPNQPSSSSAHHPSHDASTETDGTKGSSAQGRGRQTGGGGSAAATESSAGAQGGASETGGGGESPPKPVMTPDNRQLPPVPPAFQYRPNGIKIFSSIFDAVSLLMERRMLLFRDGKYLSSSLGASVISSGLDINDGFSV